VALEPGSVYSLTTTTGQHKGICNTPPPADFPLPYQDDFESYAPGIMAKYLSDQAGIFEVAERADGGKCLRQTVAQRGIEWPPYPNPEPYTIIGGTKWGNYQVACDAYVEKAGQVALFGRIAKAVPTFSAEGICQPPQGYWLRVGTDGRWDLKACNKTLAAGTVFFAADRWHKLALKFVGSNIGVYIDGVAVKAMKDGTFRVGMAGLGSGWNNARYDNFSVQPIGGPE
jgi:hypothetical protein